MSYNPPLVPRRAAPPPPSGYSPGGTPPPQPSRTNRPSLTTPPQSSQYRNAPPVPTSSYSPVAQQRNPVPTPSSPSNLPSNGNTQQSQGFWGSVTSGFSSMWNGNPQQSPTTNTQPQQVPQNDSRSELMSGSTVKPKPKFQVNDPAWKKMEGDSDAQEQYYLNLAQQSDGGALQRALQAASNSENIGLATLDGLSSQAEGLDRIDTNMESIHLQLDRGERQIKAIGLTGAAKNMVKGDTAHKQNRAVYKMAHNQQDHTLEIDDSYAKRYNSPTFNRQQQQNTPTNAAGIIKNKLNEQDAQLDQLSAKLANLQNIAGTAGNEVKRQNAQLDKINHRTEQAIHRTHDASYKMQRLM